MNTLGRTIRLLRHQQGWSQEEVARRLDISIPAYSKIETGITDINLSRLEQIAAVFGISVVQLLTFEQRPRQAGELEILQSRLRAKEEEVLELQRKVIDLFEELKAQPVSA